MMKRVIITLSALVVFFTAILAWPVKPQSIVVPSAGGNTSYPATVSGTVTSGGIPCFTSTTQSSSSALLATNAIVVGGGAGVCPGTGNGDFTYTTHTLTMGAGGLMDLSAGGQGSFKVPNVATFNTTAAILQFDSTAGAFSLGTGAAALFPAAAGGNATSSTSCASQGVTAVSATAAPTCGGLSAYITGSDYTNATAGATNVTGLSFSIAASKNYAIHCALIYQGSASTTTMTLTSTGPASPTKVTGQTLMDTTAGSGAAIFSGAFDGTTFGFTAGPSAATTTTATDLYAVLDVGILNGTTAGTWQLQATNGTGTLTIRQGSFCTIQ